MLKRCESPGPRTWGPERRTRTFAPRTGSDPSGIESVHGQFIELRTDTREFLQRVATYLVIPTKPDGTVVSDHGTFTLDAEGGQAIEDAFISRGNDMLVDFEHQSIPEHARADGLAPAAGWIKALKFVAGSGMTARIEWAGDTADMIYHKVYRYLSPVWYRDARNRIVGLKNVGLVNEPAIHGYPPLANARGTKGIIVNSATAEPIAAVANATDDATPTGDGMEGVIAQLRSALQLPDDATAADVLSACLARLKAPAEAVPQRIRASLGLDDKADATMVVSAIKGLREVAVPVHGYRMGTGLAIPVSRPTPVRWTAAPPIPTRLPPAPAAAASPTWTRTATGLPNASTTAPACVTRNRWMPTRTASVTRVTHAWMSTATASACCSPESDRPPARATTARR